MACGSALGEEALDLAGGRVDLHLQVLLLRCLQIPLQTPTTVTLHLPMATALDLTDAPGLLDGHG